MIVKNEIYIQNLKENLAYFEYLLYLCIVKTNKARPGSGFIRTLYVIRHCKDSNNFANRPAFYKNFSHKNKQNRKR